MIVDQVLPDRRRVPPATERLGDQLAIGLARADTGHTPRRQDARLGEYPRGNGRMCRPFVWPAAPADARGAQVAADVWRRTPVAALMPSTRPGDRAPRSVAASLGPRRCSSGRGTIGLQPSSTSTLRLRSRRTSSFATRTCVRSDLYRLGLQLVSISGAMLRSVKDVASSVFEGVLTDGNPTARTTSRYTNRVREHGGINRLIVTPPIQPSARGTERSWPRRSRTMRVA